LECRHSGATTCYYRRHFLKFDTNPSGGVVVANLSQDKTFDALAWVIRHFVPLIVDDPQTLRRSMLQKMAINTYMTFSNLAFAVLVLEHHILKWRNLVHFEFKTGCAPPKEYARQQSGGLLYKNGISGEEAKMRFNALCHYFFTNFQPSKHPFSSMPLPSFDAKGPHFQGGRNQAKLQTRRDELIKMDAIRNKAEIKNCPSNIFTPSYKIEDNVIHRVVYSVYL
jgi:hypothetical protein